jgi:hypothetical protein
MVTACEHRNDLPQKEFSVNQTSLLRRIALLRWIGLVAVAVVPLAVAQHAMSPDHQMPASEGGARPADTRKVVNFPKQLKERELANMRDHLRTLSEIQNHLAKYDFDRAADIAEKRLGMSSFDLHGSHEVAPYMPKGMQEAGTALHHAASRFAVAAQEAAVDRDLGRALGALNEVTQTCIACHAVYRLR